MSTATARGSAPGRWLYGPAADLLLGCGLAYVPVFVLYAVFAERMESVFPMALTPLLLLLLSTPHYGATLLRVYERAEDRRRYAFFAMGATLLLGATFLWGVEDAFVGSWLITVYLTWSPWHYAAQNYGIGLMFLRRADVPVPPLAKRLYRGTFTLSFALTFLVIHGPDPLAAYAPGGVSGGLHRFLPLGIPDTVREPLLWVTGTLYGACVVGSAVLFVRRSARVRDLLPAAALVATQALWFTVPALAHHLHRLQDVAPLASVRADYAFVWVAAGHAAQYLWITSWFARRSGRSRGNVSFFVKALLAGVAIWTVPAYLLAPGMLGRLPFDAGLSLSVASAVNIHHFVLDGVIWKLRDGPVARVLLRPEPPPDVAPPPPGRGLLRRGVWVAGALSLVVAVLGTLYSFSGFDPALARGDEETARAHLRILRLLGRDGPAYHVKLGLAALRRRDAAQAAADFRAANDVHPSAIGNAGLAEAALLRGDVATARRAYEAALRIDPDHAASLVGLATIYLRAGDPARARPLVRRAEARAGRDVTLPPDARRRIDELVGSMRAASDGLY